MSASDRRESLFAMIGYDTKAIRFMTLPLFASALLLVACGSEPKKEPAAAVAPATPAEGPPPVTAPEAGAPTSAADAGGSATAGKDKAAECSAWVDEAQSTIDAERIAVDKACKKDTDCVAIKGRACGFNCANGAIPKAEEKEWSDAVTKVKDGVCRKWSDNDCAKVNTRPPPVCQERKVWCDKGHCALKDK